MNNKHLFMIALAGLTLSFSSGAHAHMKADKETEKCYGVSKAGENACNSSDGAHACAGMAEVDYSEHEWKLVPKGTCKELQAALTKDQ